VLASKAPVLTPVLLFGSFEPQGSFHFFVVILGLDPGIQNSFALIPWFRGTPALGAEDTQSTKAKENIMTWEQFAEAESIVRKLTGM